MARKSKPKFHASRAIRAEHTLGFYKHLLGESGRVDAGAIRDLLQDALHWLAAQRKPNDYPEPIDTLVGACDSAIRDFPHELAEGEPDAPGLTDDLTADLWWFIENVSDEAPDRTDRLFALRERVRSRK
jgi:hypothetical protein